MKRYISILLSAAFALTQWSCDDVKIDEVVSHAPVIDSFTPASAPVGAEIIVTGEYLNNVTEAYIGGTAVEIASKVSNKLMSLKVTDGVGSGAIVLVNPEGSGSSQGSFTCTFAVPSLSASLIQSSAEMGEEILLSGDNLNAVKAVLFIASGETAAHAAAIITRNDEEMVVKVPYVENADAAIVLQYSDGSADVTTAEASAPRINVVRYVPVFDAYTFEKTAVGRSVTLTGQYLNNVDKVMVGDFEATIFKEAGKLTFTVPAGDFADGDTPVTLRVLYFDENESLTLADPFVVFVPFVKFWENVMTVCQGRWEASTFASFFSPENGRVYANELWKSELDPVALKYSNSQWSAANTPKAGVVSDEDYDSVLPYFFFSSVSGNVLQINSPANSNSQLKNFFINLSGTPANDYRVPGGNNNMPGTPIIAFRYLNPNSTNAAELDLIAKVKADQIDNINEALFPINEEAMTIAGISVSSFAGGIKSSSWCDRQTETLVDDPAYNPDAVFLVAYYSNNGFNKSATASNIKRLGLIHVTNINWGVSANNDYRNSAVTFNCWWQKYDYDYSKL